MIIEGKYRTSHHPAVMNLAGTFSILILGLKYIYIYIYIYIPRIGVSIFLGEPLELFVIEGSINHGTL